MPCDPRIDRSALRARSQPCRDQNGRPVVRMLRSCSRRMLITVLGMRRSSAESTSASCLPRCRVRRNTAPDTPAGRSRSGVQSRDDRRGHHDPLLRGDRGGRPGHRQGRSSTQPAPRVLRRRDRRSAGRRRQAVTRQRLAAAVLWHLVGAISALELPAAGRADFNAIGASSLLRRCGVPVSSSARCAASPRDVPLSS